MSRPAMGLSIRALVVALCALASASASAQTGTVAVELRITSASITSVNDPATAGPQDLVVHGLAPAETKLVEVVGGEFSYLTWIAAHSSTAVGPRLIFELSDRILTDDPPCKPRRVIARLLVQPRGVESAIPGEAELSAVCNPLLQRMTPLDFVEKLADLAETMLRTGDTREQIERTLAFEVPLARTLVSDAARQRLFLPVVNLHARKESKIEVRFGDDENRYLLLHPFTPETDRTLVKVKDFACDEITAGNSIADSFGAFWHPSLPSLLAACGEPLAYMKHYEPSTPVEGRLSPPVDAGGGPARPGIVTDLPGGEP